MEEETQETKTQTPDYSQFEEIPLKEETPISETMEIEIPPSDFPFSHQIHRGSSNIESFQSDEIPQKEETPILETMEIENPCSDSPKSDQTLAGSLKIEDESAKEESGKVDDAQCRKTLEELTLEGGKKLEDTEFVETLDVKEGGVTLEEAQIADILNVFDKEEGKDTEFTKIVSELEDVSLVDIIENTVDFDDDGEGGSSSNNVVSRVRPFRGPYGPWNDFDLPNQCMCGSCFEDEEDEEGRYRRDRAMRGPWPMRRPFYDGEHGPMRRTFYNGEPPHCRNGCFSDPRMMRRDYHNRRCSKRRNHPCARDREAEMYGLHPYCNMGRDSERFRYTSMGCPEPEPCPVGAGLRNLGNTCFLNAIMQCFTHTVPLVQGLLSLKHDSSSHGADEFCVLCAVRDQIEHSLGYSGRVVSPSNLVDNLSQISSFFQRYQQEDAHEFLQCLLDKLDSNWSEFVANANDSSAPDDTLVKQIFGGCLVSQVRCCNCGHNSDTYEPLIDLSLEIEDVDSLESALNSFTKVESIEDTEKFTCESCKEQVKVEKQLMLEQAPSVAALHLKRFKSDGVLVEKIDKKVEFPLELDLGPYTKGSTNENEHLKYELFAVVVHVGISSTAGHYFCYIRTDPDKWYRFDDSQVTMVCEENVLCQDAYILFYARKGTPWFGSLIEKWKVECREKISSTSPKSVLDDMDHPSTSYSAGTGLHGCEVGEKRDAIGDNSTAPASESRKDEVETKAGVEIGLHDCEADGMRDATGDTSVTPATELMQDEVQTNAIDAQDSAIPNQTSASSSCVPINVEIKEDKFELDVLSLMEENDASEDKTWSKNIGEIEQIDGGTCTFSHVESMSGGEPGNGVGIKPSTPLSLNILSDEEPAEVAYLIPLNHLKIEDKASSAKKFINTEKQDMKRKEAVKYIRKSMPSGRRQLFLAALSAPRSDSSLSKKRKRPVPIFHGKHSPKKGVKISPKRVLQPVTV